MNFLFFRKSLRQCFQWNKTIFYFRGISTVLGIETSYDDTAVCILDSERRILSSRKYSDKTIAAKLGGNAPFISAIQHRLKIDDLLNECLKESRIRYSDLDAVAVSNRPGSIVCLKVGADKALSIARDYRLKLIPIHHMRAHATVLRLTDPTLEYPYVSLLISGGHSQIVVVRGPETFETLGDIFLGGSAGECLDKLARKLGLEPHGSHYAAALEQMAANASENAFLKHEIRGPTTLGADFQFSNIKSSYYSRISKYLSENNNQLNEGDLQDFCASIQYSVMAHLCKKLVIALKYLIDNDLFVGENSQWRRKLVVAGGVASNKYLMKCFSIVTEPYGFETLAPTPQLCTDNAEMVAWLGVESLQAGSQSILNFEQLPDVLRVACVSPTGTNLREKLPRRTKKMFSPKQIHLRACSNS